MGLGEYKIVGTPLESNLKVTSIKFDKVILLENQGVKDKELEDVGQYQKLVGILLYLTMTRIDIAHVV